MKKWKIILPSLVAVASAPLVTFVGCTNENVKSSCNLNYINKNEPAETHTITLDANGGHFAKNDILTITVDGDETPLKDVIGYEQPTWHTKFIYWVDENDERINVHNPVTTDLYLKATYEETCLISMSNPFKDGYEIEEKMAQPNQKVSLHITSVLDMHSDSLESVTIGGKPYRDLSTFVVLEGKKNAIFSIPADDMNGDVVLRFKEVTPPKADSFWADDWDTIIYYSRQGLDVLAKAYGCPGHPTWFVGTSRTVYINNHYHNVRVVACNQDCTDLQHKKPAALTFQFEDLISNETDGSFLSIDWNDGDKPSYDEYWNSNIENALNGKENNVEWHDKDKHLVPKNQQLSVYSMFKRDNISLYTHIKNVYRNVTCKEENRTRKPVYKKTKIFLPVVANYFSNRGIENTEGCDFIQSAESIRCYEMEGQPHPDGQAQYEYYARPYNIGNEPMCYGNYSFFDCLRLWDVARTSPYPSMGYGSSDYWCASPYLFYPSNSAWKIDVYDMGFINFNGAHAYYGIAPCFCL